MLGKKLYTDMQQTQKKTKIFVNNVKLNGMMDEEARKILLLFELRNLSDENNQTKTEQNNKEFQRKYTNLKIIQEMKLKLGKKILSKRIRIELFVIR